MKSIKKHITFHPQLYRFAERRAKMYGVSVAEYIRHLIMEDSKKLIPKTPDDGTTYNIIGRPKQLEKILEEIL
jgi:hypothetical protein